ncbi:MAG: hypothetical protein IPP34_15360 [Bacteroidetes bacterium]|nr:hypothetical protein [Bacteroidota bacterium]
MKQNWSTWKFKSAIFILLYFSISWLDSFKVEANASVPYKTTPIYKHFSVEDGLPGATIYCAEQDTDGFMWFGTDAGVSRFDGKEFVNYGVQDGVSDSDVLRIFEDSKGRIWF